MPVKTPCAIVRWWQRLLQPVPQNYNAALYGRYRGKVVALRPVLNKDRPWLVESWVSDPDQTKVVDRMLDEPKPAVECGGAGQNALPDFGSVKVPI